MNPSQFLSALKARFGIFAVALLATVATATAVSLIMPKVYRATSSVVIDTRQEQSVNNSVNMLFSPQERAAYMQTQMDIITSEKVAQEVVTRLELTDKPQLQAEFAEMDDGGGTMEEWLAGRLLRDLEVETSQSAVMTISYSTDNPQYSAKVANFFAQAYIDRVLELRVEPTKHAATWFDEQLTALRASLEESQATLTRFQQEHGIVSADENMDFGYTNLTELSAQMARAREDTLDMQTRQQQAKMLRERGLPLDNLPDVNDDSLIAALRQRVEDGEARLQELATQYGINHPTYKRQLAENRSRQARLQSEIDRLVAAAGSRAEQGQDMEGALRADFEEQRDELLEAKANRDRMSLLKRNVQTAQNAYDTVMQRYLVSQVESRASKTNVALLNPAVAPRIPHRPNIPLNIVLSIVVGTMLGTAIVVMLELGDRRVRTIADLQYGPDVPLLGELSAWQPPQRLLVAGPGSPGRSLPRPD